MSRKRRDPCEWPGCQLIPKGIEVKPIVRCTTRIMLQPRHVLLYPGLDLLGAMVAIQKNRVGEMFEMNFVAVPAAVEAEEQNHRTMHHGSKQNWSGREGGRPAKKMTLRRLVGAENAIT